MNHIIVSYVMQHVTCDFFSNLNSVEIGAVHMIFEVAPKEIIAGIHVR
jgi:hypothetical protein